MKKAKTMRIASLLLVLVLVTTCFVGTTFAKYTSSATGNDSATVAKWSIEVNNNQLATDSPTVVFNLFDTINDTGNTDDETDVADGKIAPGTSGSFQFDIENLSEVNAKYTVKIDVTNENNIPLQFSTNGTQWASSLTSTTIEGDLDMNDGAATRTVYWRWVFEDGGTDEAKAANDADDTAFGIAAQTDAPEVTVTATITATQVD